MTEAQALREVADAARAFLLACQRAVPHMGGVFAASLVMFVQKTFLPYAEQIELSARRAEAEEARD